MSITPKIAEQEYVHSIYSRLATYQQNDAKNSSPRIWPRVRQFVDQQAAGSVVLDVGCGEAKYTATKCHVIGFDTCPEVLSSSKKEDIDLCLADALSIPIRDSSVDAILNVSVIHHLATADRRRQMLQECCRCLRVGGQMLIYAWAFEQPSADFAAQDILVPWNMHETSIAGRLPKVKFHLNTTKEQRIIAASVPVSISDVSPSPKWYTAVLNKVSFLTEQLPYFAKRCPTSPGSYGRNHSPSASTSGSISSPMVQRLPSAAPQFFPITAAILSGIKKWSPKLEKTIASLLVPVEEQYADELSQVIMREAITEAMSTLQEVAFYRYYHVFKEGELANLVDSIDDLRIVSNSFEHGNYCVTAEKMPKNYIRP
ncbi:unnamed protein product [Caenorhabditis sp. 36 PRJEB53466]|nr:unnamed protein product [Caenorhabditis sp. 36 PRJEB53466]